MHRSGPILALRKRLELALRCMCTYEFQACLMHGPIMHGPVMHGPLGRVKRLEMQGVHAKHNGQSMHRQQAELAHLRASAAAESSVVPKVYSGCT